MGWFYGSQTATAAKTPGQRTGVKVTRRPAPAKKAGAKRVSNVSRVAKSKVAGSYKPATRTKVSASLNKTHKMTRSDPPRGHSETYHKGAIRDFGSKKKSRFESITHLLDTKTAIDPEKFTSEMDKKLKDSSLYFQSIQDPLQGAGAKIPDITSIPTSTFQLVQRIEVTVNANGVAGFFIPSPHFAAANVGANPNNVYAGYQIADNTSTAAAITWTTGVNDWAGYTSFASNVAVCRTVSAAIYAEYQGTELQDSGQFSVGFVPGLLNRPSSVNNAQIQAYSSIIPTNRNTPCMVRYLPQGFYDVAFLLPNGASGPNTDSMYIIGAGMTAGATVLFTFVGNYEFQPIRSSVNLIDVQPSPNDMFECQKVSQWCQEINSTGIVDSKYVDVTPSSVATERAEVEIINQEKEESLGGLGMIGEVLDFAIPTLINVLPLLL